MLTQPPEAGRVGRQLCLQLGMHSFATTIQCQADSSNHGLQGCLAKCWLSAYMWQSSRSMATILSCSGTWTTQALDFAAAKDLFLMAALGRTAG